MLSCKPLFKENINWLAPTKICVYPYASADYLRFTENCETQFSSQMFNEKFSLSPLLSRPYFVSHNYVMIFIIKSIKNALI